VIIPVTNTYRETVRFSDSKETAQEEPEIHVAFFITSSPEAKNRW